MIKDAHVMNSEGMVTFHKLHCTQTEALSQHNTWMATQWQDAVCPAGYSAQRDGSHPKQRSTNTYFLRPLNCAV
jgi:hypothetical protein